MRIFRYCSVFVLCISLFFNQRNQAFASSKDSLLQIINSKANDTTIIAANLALGELLIYNNPDTAYIIWSSTQKKLEDILKRSTPILSKTNVPLLESLEKFYAVTLNNIGFYYDFRGEYKPALNYYQKSLEINIRLKVWNEVSNTLNNIGAVNFNLGDVGKATNYFKRALSVIENSKIFVSIALCYSNLAYIYQYQGNYDSSFYYNFKSLHIRQKINDKEGIAVSLTNIGVLFYKKGDIEKALESWRQGAVIQENIGDKRGLAASLSNMASIFKDIGDGKKSIEYHLKSLKLEREIGNKQGIAKSLNNIGLLYYNKDSINHDYQNLTKALNYFKESIAISQEMGDKGTTALTSHNIGQIFLELNQLDSAIYFYSSAFKIYNELGDKEGIAMSQSSLGKLHLRLGNFKLAKEMGLKSIKISEELGYPDNIERASGLLRLVYKKEKNFEKAYYYYEIEMNMKDSISNNENFKKTQKLQARYEFQKKAAIDSIAHNKALQIKNLEISRNEEIKKKQRIAIYSFVLGFIVILIFLIIIFKLFIQKKKANELLILKNQEILQQKEEITAQRDEIESQNNQITEAYNIIEHKNKNITDSIRYALRIQSAMLPPQTFINNLIPESFILYKPKSIVSGDFYWVDKKDDYIYIAAVDCTGHGVPGAFMSIVGYNLLNQALNEKKILEPNLIIAYLSEQIAKTLRQNESDSTVKDGMDLVLLRMNLINKTAAISAVHNPIYLIRNNELQEIKGDKWPIGKAFNEKFNSYSQHNLQIEMGDTFYLFSDGYMDQFNGENGKKFTSAKFKELLLQNNFMSMQEQKNILEQTIDSWKGDSEQIDDMMIIGVKIS